MNDQINHMKTISRTVSSAQILSPRQSPRRHRSSIVQTPKSSLSSIATSSPLAPSRVRVNSYKRSWVWAHFKSVTVDDNIRHVCQVELPTGVACGACIIPEKSSSTKGLIRHLNRVHQIFETTYPDTVNFGERGTMAYVSILCFSSPLIILI